MNETTATNTKYELRMGSVREFMERAVQGEYAIPSIQRPFVWKPHQVARLVDSLLHDWPCGSLLLWEPGGVQHVFPTRRFATCVWSEDAFAARRKRAEKAGAAAENSHAEPDEAPMPRTSLVLDGQQRLQSLVLAFHECSEGITCTDTEWKRDVDLSGGRRGEWSRRRLCFNLGKWEEGMEEKAHSFHYLDADAPEDACLVWVPAHELSAATRRRGLVPLNEVLRPAAVEERYPKAWAWLRSRVEALMETKMVALVVRGMAGEGDMEEAIVTIFTRLNTSGTPLTREQILSARIKKAWVDFPERLEAMRANLAKEDFEGTLDDDELVRGFNILVFAHTQERDLNRAYEKLAGQWEAVWASFEANTTRVLMALYNRFVRKNTEFRSMYVIWYAVALFHLQQKKTGLPVDTEDGELGEVLVKWVFVTTWAKIWANRSGQSVRKYNEKLRVLAGSPATVLVKVALRDWLADAGLISAARDFISNLQASARGSVREYYTPLWVWMRLSGERRNLLTAFAPSPDKWEVDHLVPADWVKGDKHPEIGSHLVNELGNCWLLPCKANKVKSKKDFARFLEDSDCIRSLADIAAALNCSEGTRHLALTETDNLRCLEQLVVARRDSMKAALKQYISTAGECSLHFFSPYDLFDPAAYELYRGVEFAQLMIREKLKSRNDYLRYVRSVMRREAGKKAKGVELLPAWTLEQVQQMVEAGEEALLRAEPVRLQANSSYVSAWNKYMDFLFGGTSAPSDSLSRSRAPSRRSGQHPPVYREVQFYESETLSGYNKDIRNSYKTGARKGCALLGYTEEDFRMLCEELSPDEALSDVEDIRAEVRRKRLTGIPTGFNKYLEFLENEVIGR